MNKEELLKLLKEKKDLLKRTEVVYHQLNGQVGMLEDIIEDLKKEPISKESK
jgi:hypothetical protein